ELQAMRALERLFDVSTCNRAVHLVLRTDLTGHLNAHRFKFRLENFGITLSCRCSLFGFGFELFNARQITSGRRRGETTRNEEVASVARTASHNVSAFAEMLHLVLEHYLDGHCHRNLLLVGGEGQQRNVARPFDVQSEFALVLCAAARDSSRYDLAAFRDEELQQLGILVVDLRCTFSAKRAASTTTSTLERPSAIALVEGLIKGASIVGPIVGSIVGIQVVHSSSSSAAESSEPDSSSPSLSSCSSTGSLR